MSAHHLASPSSASRWIKCTGSLELIQLYPQPYITTPQAEYGSRVHGYAKAILDSSDRSSIVNFFSKVAPHDTEPMHEALEFIEYLNTLRTPGDRMVIEQKVGIPSILDSLFGTVDAIIYTHDMLHIVDLKTGRLPVSADNNPQLLLYALGAVDTYNLSPDNIRLHIYQNNQRCGNNINTTNISLEYLHEFRLCVRSILALAIHGIYRYTLGDHCEYCPVRKHCPAQLTRVLHEYRSANQQAGSLVTLTTKEKASLYQGIKGLQSTMDLLYNELLDANENDLLSCNLQIKTKKLPEKYIDSEKALEKLTNAGYNDVTTVSLISPAKLKKVNKEAYQMLLDSNEIQQGTSKYLTTGGEHDTSS